MAGGIAGLFIAWGLCAAAQQPVDATNLLRNPSFEQPGSAGEPIEGWRALSGHWSVIATEDAAEGGRLLSPRRAGFSRMRQVVSYRTAELERPGMILRASVRGRGPVELRVRATSLRHPQELRAIRLGQAEASWQELALEFNYPLGADRIWVELVSMGEAEFDAVSLRRHAASASAVATDASSLPPDARALRILDAGKGEDSLEREQLLTDLVCEPGPTELLIEMATLDTYPADVQRAAIRSMARVQSAALLTDLPARLRQPQSLADVATLERVACEYGLLRAYVPLLESQLESSALPAAQDAVMRILAEAGDPRFFAAMKKLYFSAELERRAAWLEAAAEFDSVEALEELAAQLRRARGVERNLAERAFLHAARSGEDLSARAWLLESGLAHRDSFVRRASLIALGPEFEPVEISAALRLTRDSDADVLRTLIPILGAHRSQASERALQGLVGHRNTEVAADAMRAYWALRNGDSGVRSFARGVIVGEGQWAVQQTAIDLLARDDRNLPRQRLRKLAVESPDWRVARAAAETLIARGEAVPEEARIAPDQPQVLIVVALDPAPIVEGMPSSVGPWLQLRERLAAMDAEPQLSLAGLPPARWRAPVFENGSARIEAFDAWFSGRAPTIGLGSLGGLREALRIACRAADATDLIVVLDADFPDGSLEDWFDLATDFRRWNAHQRLSLSFVTAEDGGRISLALREFAPVAD